MKSVNKCLIYNGQKLSKNKKLRKVNFINKED